MRTRTTDLPTVSEPREFGAVVLDAKGRPWVRVFAPDSYACWYNPQAGWKPWTGTEAQEVIRTSVA